VTNHNNGTAIVDVDSVLDLWRLYLGHIIAKDAVGREIWFNLRIPPPISAMVLPLHTLHLIMCDALSVKGAGWLAQRLVLDRAAADGQIPEFVGGSKPNPDNNLITLHILNLQIVKKIEVSCIEPSYNSAGCTPTASPPAARQTNACDQCLNPPKCTDQHDKSCIFEHLCYQYQAPSAGTLHQPSLFLPPPAAALLPPALLPPALLSLIRTIVLITPMQDAGEYRTDEGWMLRVATEQEIAEAAGSRRSQSMVKTGLIFELPHTIAPSRAFPAIIQNIGFSIAPEDFRRISYNTYGTGFRVYAPDEEAFFNTLSKQIPVGHTAVTFIGSDWSLVGPTSPTDPEVSKHAREAYAAGKRCAEMFPQHAIPKGFRGAADRTAGNRAAGAAGGQVGGSSAAGGRAAGGSAAGGRAAGSNTAGAPQFDAEEIQQLFGEALSAYMQKASIRAKNSIMLVGHGSCQQRKTLNEWLALPSQLAMLCICSAANTMLTCPPRHLHPKTAHQLRQQHLLSSQVHMQTELPVSPPLHLQLPAIDPRLTRSASALSNCRPS
jgi:hypothetical protein